MRKSLLALILVGSLLVVAVTTVLAVNPAADSIPNVGDIDVPADAAAVTNADTNAGVLTEGAPAPAATEGLATAEAAGSAGLTGDPVADGIPAVESISVPANGAAGDNPPTDVPPPAATDGLAMAEAAGPTSLIGLESVPVPAADQAGDNPPAAAPTGDAANGLFVAEVPGTP